MNGKFINVVHKCVPPKIKKSHGIGTVWQCDCGQKFELYQPPIVSGVPYLGPIWGNHPLQTENLQSRKYWWQ